MRALSIATCLLGLSLAFPVTAPAWAQDSGNPFCNESIEKASPKTIASLAKKGANLNVICPDTKRTPLQSQLFSDHTANALAMLAAGANPSIPDQIDQQTALYQARNAKVAEALIKHGADVNARDDHQQTPIFMQTAGTSLDVVDVLLRHGADINARDNENETPLISAVTQADPTMVAALVARGADMSVRDSNGRTALGNALNFASSSLTEPDQVQLQNQIVQMLEAKGAPQ
jgi:ankyrin repeat protein